MDKQIGDRSYQPEPHSADDDTLMEELRVLVNRLDPVPPEMAAAARSSFAWYTMDSELAQFTHDPQLDADRMELARASGMPEILTFEASGLAIEVEVTPAPDGLRLLGQLLPAQPGRVIVRHSGETTTVEVDALGRFEAERLASGPLSLRCEAAGKVVDTDWFLP